MVVAILAVLVAVAIPTFGAYRKSSVDARMKSDLEAASKAVEAFYGSNGNSYAGVTLNILKTHGYRQSPSLTLSVAGSAAGYRITARAAGGNTTRFRLDSATGQIR